VTNNNVALRLVSSNARTRRSSQVDRVVLRTAQGINRVEAQQWRLFFSLWTP